MELGCSFVRPGSHGISGYPGPLALVIFHLTPYWVVVYRVSLTTERGQVHLAVHIKQPSRGG